MRPVAYSKGRRLRFIISRRAIMAYKKKSWREKLADSKDLPRVEPIPEKMSAQWGTGTLVIPAPVEVDEIMKRVPEGKLITVNEIRGILAKKHGATIGQLDRDVMFYLRSRGIPVEDARRLLIHAFASEVVDAIPVPWVREQVGAALFTSVGAGPEEGRP